MRIGPQKSIDQRLSVKLRSGSTRVGPAELVLGYENYHDGGAPALVLSDALKVEVQK